MREVTGWATTPYVDEFTEAAGDFLRMEPARNTVMLTVTGNFLVSGQAEATGDAGAAVHRPGRSHEQRLYERIGYEHVEDRVVLSFGPRETSVAEPQETLL